MGVHYGAIVLLRDNIVWYIRSPLLVLVFGSTNMSTYSLNPATNDAFDAFILPHFITQRHRRSGAGSTLMFISEPDEDNHGRSGGG